MIRRRRARRGARSFFVTLGGCSGEKRPIGLARSPSTGPSRDRCVCLDRSSAFSRRCPQVGRRVLLLRSPSALPQCRGMLRWRRVRCGRCADRRVRRFRRRYRTRHLPSTCTSGIGSGQPSSPISSMNAAVARRRRVRVPRHRPQRTAPFRYCQRRDRRTTPGLRVGAENFGQCGRVVGARRRNERIDRCFRGREGLLRHRRRSRGRLRREA